MIAVDTSAIIAILKQEPGWQTVARSFADATRLCISAGTLSEERIVAAARNGTTGLERLLDDDRIEIVPVDAISARQIEAAYRAFGKGFHPASLNFGDCFAYALAKDRGLPLLFVGDDFARTDLIAA